MIVSKFRISALLATAALLTACGGGGGGGTSTTPPPPSSGGSSNTGGSNPSTPTNPSNPSNPTDSQTPTKKLSSNGMVIEQMVGAVLVIEGAGKSGIKDIPAAAKPIVEAHGPSPVCDSTCDSYDRKNWYNVEIPSLGTVRIIGWMDLNTNGLFDVMSEQLVYDFTDVSGVTGSVMLLRDSQDATMYNMTLGNVYESQSYGAKVGQTKTLLFSGALMVRTLQPGVLRIGDFDRIPSSTRNIILHKMSADGTTRVGGYDTIATVDTAEANEDAVQASLDWLVLCNGCADANKQYTLQTIDALDFGTVGGHFQLEGGKFVITTDASGASKTALRVSVDPDPSYLLVEIDNGADGSVDSTERIAQSDIDFRLP